MAASMNFNGSEFLPIPVDRLRALLSDPQVLRAILPGCVSLAAVGPDEYRIEVQQRLGPYDDLFSGILSLDWVGPNSNLDFAAELEGPNGRVTITGRADPDPQGTDGLLLRYSGAVETDGRVATVPPRLLETTSNAYSRRLFAALNGVIAGEEPAAPRETTAPADDVATSGFRIPAWAAFLLAGLAGIVILRLLDNRRINRMRSSDTVDDSA